MTAGRGGAALVTGATGRLGREVVAALAARGYAVAVHCHAALPAARSLAAALGDPSLAVTADLREEGAVRALVHRVADHFGRLDAVVHCAGRRAATPLDEMTAADLRLPFDVRVAGGFVVAQEVAAVMLGQETGGTIVFVHRAIAAPPGDVGGAAAEAAIPGLAAALAAEFARRQPLVRVACVAADPGDPAAGAAAAVAAITRATPAAEA